MTMNKRVIPVAMMWGQAAEIVNKRARAGGNDVGSSGGDTSEQEGERQQR